MITLKNEQVTRLIDEYISAMQATHHDDSQIIDILADIFDRSELEQLGYGDFVKDYFDEQDAENGDFRIKADITVELTAKDIDDIMATALEGGITHWCAFADTVGPMLGEYSSDQISRGGKLILHDKESDDKWELDYKKFLKGLAQYIENGGASCVVDECIDPAEIDADGADSIIQYALFGELVFG